jgi:hypothetical protein
VLVKLQITANYQPHESGTKTHHYYLKIHRQTDVTSGLNTRQLLLGAALNPAAYHLTTSLHKHLPARHTSVGERPISWDPCHCHALLTRQAVLWWRHLYACLQPQSVQSITTLIRMVALRTQSLCVNHHQVPLHRQKTKRLAVYVLDSLLLPWERVG